MGGGVGLDVWDGVWEGVWEGRIVVCARVCVCYLSFVGEKIVCVRVL